jgi:hypothetical protein
MYAASWSTLLLLVRLAHNMAEDILKWQAYFAITVVFTSLPIVLFEWGSQLQVGGREQLIPVCFMGNSYTPLLYSKGTEWFQSRLLNSVTANHDIYFPFFTMLFYI